MLINVLICLTMIVDLVGSTRPTMKLTFNPNEKFYSRDTEIEIQCEIFNPADNEGTAQLWHVDLRTGKRTPLSRSTVKTPSDDLPEVLKNNKNNRYDYVKKNHIRIRRLQLEDSARYECNCPDCKENISKESRELQVVQPSEPKFFIEPTLPLHENSRATIKCLTENFYPYVGHRILRNHIEITNDGRSSLSNGQIFPLKFVWEATIQPTAEWHNSTIRCIVTEGNVEQQAVQTLEVLFNPRFHKCDEKQLVDENKDQTVLSCSFSGNPAPSVIWRRSNDPKPIENSSGITIQTIDESNGKQTTFLKLDRNKFPSANNISGEFLFKEFIKSTFSVQLTVNGNERGTRSIQIVRNANQIRSSSTNGSIQQRISNIFLIFIFIFNGFFLFLVF